MKSFWTRFPGWIGGYYTFVQALLTWTNPTFLLISEENAMVYSKCTTRPTLPSSTWTDLLCLNDHTLNIASASPKCLQTAGFITPATCSWFFTRSSACQNKYHLGSRSKLLPFMDKLLLSWSWFFPSWHELLKLLTVLLVFAYFYHPFHCKLPSPEGEWALKPTVLIWWLTANLKHWQITYKTEAGPWGEVATQKLGTMLCWQGCEGELPAQPYTNLVTHSALAINQAFILGNSFLLSSSLPFIFLLSFLYLCWLTLISFLSTKYDIRSAF